MSMKKRLLGFKSVRIESYFSLVIALGIFLFLSSLFPQMVHAKHYEWKTTLDGAAFSKMDGDDYSLECPTYERGVRLNLDWTGGQSDAHYIFLLPPRNYSNIYAYQAVHISINSNNGLKIYARNRETSEYDLVGEVDAGVQEVTLSSYTYRSDPKDDNLYSELDIKIVPKVYLLGGANTDLEYVRLSWEFDSENPYLDEYSIALGGSKVYSEVKRAYTDYWNPASEKVHLDLIFEAYTYALSYAQNIASMAYSNDILSAVRSASEAVDDFTKLLGELEKEMDWFYFWNFPLGSLVPICGNYHENIRYYAGEAEDSLKQLGLYFIEYGSNGSLTISEADSIRNHITNNITPNCVGVYNNFCEQTNSLFEFLYNNILIQYDTIDITQIDDNWLKDTAGIAQDMIASSRPVVFFICNDDAVAHGHLTENFIDGNRSYHPKFRDALESIKNNLPADDQPDITPPTGVSASDGTYTDKIHISLNAVSGAYGYDVYRSTTNNSATASWIFYTSATGEDDTDVVTGQVYYYWVKAKKNVDGTILVSDFSVSDSGYVGNIVSPNLSYHSYQIVDDNSGGSSGNGDGDVNSSETIELILTLQNTDSANANNVNAQLSTSDAYVTISDADENYGDIAAGYTGSCQADYDFTVSSNCPDGHVVTFNLNIQSDEGSWSDSFQITVVTVADTTPPDTYITSGPSGNTTYNDVTFTYTGSDDMTSTNNLIYSYAFCEIVSCDELGAWSGYTSSTSKNYNNLPIGTYMFDVKAKDQMGKIDPSPALRIFSVVEESSTWVFDILDNGDVRTDISDHNYYGTGYVDLTIDSSDKLHISYRDHEGKLKYATNASGAWITEAVDSTGNGGQWNFIAIDSTGKVHISYDNDGVLKYTTNASGTWIAETIDNNANIDQRFSIAVDSSGNAHLGYSHIEDAQENIERLDYATNASGVWVTESVDRIVNGECGWFSSIATDSSDRVHISYFNNWCWDCGTYKKFSLHYATNSSGSWSTRRIERILPRNSTSSIAIDSLDKVHIGYNDEEYNIKYATNTSGNWVVETMHTEGRFPSISVDSSDKIHISYLGCSMISFGGLKYATNAYGTWVTETIVSGGLVFPSIGIDSSYNVHIAYQSAGNSCLTHITRKGYTIGGKITLKGETASSAVLLTLNGADSQTTYPEASGNYNFAELDEGNYTVTPSLTGYHFFPASLSYSPLVSAQTSQDFAGLHETYDSEPDNLPDWWEQQIINADSDDGITSVQDVLPGGDFDGDGFPNLPEYLAGTDPTDENSKPIIKGDINADGSVDLTDTILALRMLVGISSGDTYSDRDVNGDGRIGLEEVIYILQKVAELRLGASGGSL